MWRIPRLPDVEKGQRIAFYGPMSSGKTFLARYLNEYYNYYMFSFARKLKAIAYELYGIDGKDGHNREILQVLGDDLRKHDNDVFTKFTLTQINAQNWLDRVVIDDLRLPREAELLKEAGFYLIKVTTPKSVRDERILRAYPALPDAPRGHETETSWSDIVGDAEIDSSTPAAIVDLGQIMSELHRGA